MYDDTNKKSLDKAEEKILCICTMFSILVFIFLTGFSVAYKPICERRHLEEIDRNYDCVPNEEFAKGIAGASIGLEDNWEVQEDYLYMVECTYNEGRYEWIVIFTPRDGNTEGRRVVGIRKDIGLIAIYQ